MLYPDNLEQKLGFDQIRELVRKECLGSLGQRYVDKMRFSDDLDMIVKLLDQTEEFRKILVQGLPFPSAYFIDAVPLLQKIRPLNSFLEPEELRDVKVSLSTIFACIQFFGNTEEFPVLKSLTTAFELNKSLYKEIDRIVGDAGEIRDDASPELRDIRRNIVAAQSSLRKELDRILRSAKREGYTDDDSSITVRGGRMVIPVTAEYKRRIKGFIHDESATGQTVFIEPAEVLEINNDIRDLELSERREIVRLLIKVCDLLREDMHQLTRAYNFLGLVDFIRAKASLALKTQAIRPEVKKEQIVKWRRARHPLLFLNFEKQHKSVVPLDIALDPNHRILLISGPNAGGKSVSLKTVGLLQYMMQSGLLVPMEEGSTMGLFQNLFIDIGDEQSIENDLSTYSSHLTNMKHFLTFSNRKTMILIDEFGTGTEPQFGGAIAESVLERLNKSGVYGVVTTHYANLKSFADKTEGIMNGAMRFDAEKLEPLYILEAGKPGSSFAFEIARKIGLPEEVLTASKQKLGTKQVDFDKLIAELEAEKTKVNKLNERLAAKERELNKSLEEYNEKTQFLDEHRKQLMNEAKQQAKELLREANQKIEQTIRDIKESKAEKEITKLVRTDLEDFKKTLEPEKQKRKTEIQKEEGAIEAGDAVRVKDSGALGEVISIKGKDAEILIGELKSTIKLNRLEKISKRSYKELLGKETTQSYSGVKISRSMSNFSPHLDIRGKRGEEAITEVEQLMDDALVFSVPEVKIIHGKGDGILRNLVRNFLSNYPQVKSMTDEHADRGGAGVTVVRLDV